MGFVESRDHRRGPGQAGILRAVSLGVNLDSSSGEGDSRDQTGRLVGLDLTLRPRSEATAPRALLVYARKVLWGHSPAHACVSSVAAFPLQGRL